MLLAAACSFALFTLILSRQEQIPPGKIANEANLQEQSPEKPQEPAIATAPLEKSADQTIAVTNRRAPPGDIYQEAQPADHTRIAARNILARSIAAMKANGAANKPESRGDP